MDNPIFITVNDERVICESIEAVIDAVREVMGDEVADAIDDEICFWRS